MKKTFTTIAVLLHIAIAVNATTPQKDTTTFKPTRVEFTAESETTKTGKEYTQYYIIVDGETYQSTKATYERYKAIARFKGQPCFVKITDKRSHAQKVVIL